jgi:hypothetical protein
MTDKILKSYSKQEVEKSTLQYFKNDDLFKEKNFNFVYLTTNLLNKKQYVGEHSTNDMNCNATKNYIGGGIMLKNAIKKYGKENFKRVVLENFKSKKEAFDNQEKYIVLYNTLNPNGYNISPKGGENVKNGVSEDTKKKISNSLSGENHPNFGKPSYNKNKKMPVDSLKNLSESRKGKIPWNKGKKYSEERKKEMSILMSGENHPNFGKHRSEETKNKIGNGNRNKKATDETKEKQRISHLNHKCSEETKEKLRNKIVTEETKNNISKSRMGKKRGKYKIKHEIYN